MEGRYKYQRLLDAAAVLACSVYVDLNPIRAGVATTSETSAYTSVPVSVELDGAAITAGQAGADSG